MAKVVVTGWRVGFAKVAFANLLRSRARYGLAAAKLATDKVLDEQPVTVEFASLAEARAFAAEVDALGASCRVSSD